MLKILFLLACFLQGVLFADDAKITKKEIRNSSIYSKIAGPFLKSYNVYEKEDDEQGYELKADLGLSELTDYESQKISLSMLSLVGGEDSGVAKETVWRDLDLFCGAVNNSHVHLLSKVDRTSTAFGKSYLTKMLASPTSDFNLLTKKQDAIKELLENEDLFITLDGYLKDIRKSESTLLSFWSNKDKENAKFIDPEFYYSLGPLKKLNKMPLALGIPHRLSQFVNALGILTFPAMRLGADISRRVHETKWDKIEGFEKVKKTLAVFFGAFKDISTLRLERDIINGMMGDNPLDIRRLGYSWGRDRIPAGKSGYRMLAFYDSYIWVVGGLTVYAAVLQQKRSVKMANYIQERLIAVASHLRSISRVYRLVAANKNLSSKLALSGKMKNLVSKNSYKSEELEKLITLLTTQTFKGKASFFSLTGRVLAAYKMMLEIKDELIDVFEALGEIDAYMSIAKLYIEHQQQSVGYAFPKFVESDLPHVSLQGVWNPFINPEDVVSNDIVIGGSDPQNVILTGPNAGGKSTVLKSVTISILLAQTIGIAPVNNMVFTPFAKINTYLNINDDIAAGNSLFKAEVLRAQDLLNVVKSLGKGEFCFSIMDEIFSGTSPREGEAASYAVSKLLGGYENSICMIATHFPKLTNLEERCSDRFKNYKVSVIKNSDGTLTYPYKLEKGAVDQNVAFDILLNEGVIEQSVLDEAQNILNEGGSI